MSDFLVRPRGWGGRLLLLLVLLILGLALFWCLHPRALGVGTPLYPWGKEAIIRITLSRGHDSLRLQRAPTGQGWQAAGNPVPVDESVEALLEFVHALRVEFPYEPLLQDTVGHYLETQGLWVSLSNASGDSLRYGLGMWPEGRILALGKGFHYIAHAPGYFSGIVRSLDLNAQSWGQRRLWHGEPSDLFSLRLEWVDRPEEGFRIARDTDSALCLYAADGSSPLPFDSLRMSTLLYAFADLPFAPLPASLRQAYDTAPSSFCPYIRITLSTRSGSGEHMLLRIPQEGGDGFDASQALLKHGDGSCYLVELFRWDAALAHLNDLQ